MSGNSLTPQEKEKRAKRNRIIMWVAIGLLLIFFLFGDRVKSALGIGSTHTSVAQTTTVPYSDTASDDIDQIDLNDEANDQDVDVSGLTAAERASLALEIFEIESQTYSSLMNTALASVLDGEIDCQTAGSIYTERQPKTCIAYKSQCTKKNWLGKCKRRESYCIEWGVQEGVPAQAEIVFAQCMFRRQSILADLDSRRPSLRLNDVVLDPNARTSAAPPSMTLRNLEAPDQPTHILIDGEAMDVFDTDTTLREQLASLQDTMRSSVVVGGVADAVQTVSIAKSIVAGHYSTPSDLVEVYYVKPDGIVAQTSINLNNFIESCDINYMEAGKSTIVDLLPLIKASLDDSHQLVGDLVRPLTNVTADGKIRLGATDFVYVGEKIGKYHYFAFSDNVPVDGSLKIVTPHHSGTSANTTTIPAVGVIGFSLKQTGGCPEILPSDKTVLNFWDSVSRSPARLANGSVQYPRWVLNVDSHGVLMEGDAFVSLAG